MRKSTFKQNNVHGLLCYLVRELSSSAKLLLAQLRRLSSLRSARFFLSGAGTYPEALSLVGRNWLNCVVVFGATTADRR